MTLTPSAQANRAHALDDVLITGELSRRAPGPPELRAENQAIQLLARRMVEQPETLLDCLTAIALDLCKAGTAGVSLLEADPSGDGMVFRWVALAGALAPHVGGSTPRDFSPCEVCLDRNAPQLFAFPERYFTYLQDARPLIVEGLVIPLRGQGQPLGTIWVVSHEEGRQFNREDLRIMASLADFTSAALGMLRLQAESQSAWEAAEEAARQKDYFLAVLAHELRSPLAPILHAALVLERTAPRRPEEARLLAVIGRQTRHLARMMDDLLDIARIRSGKLHLRSEATDLREAARRSVEALHLSGKTSGHDLALSVTAEPVMVHADPVRIEQVIGNLLTNALKYTPPGQPIRVVVGQEADQAVIAVRDGGIGMAPELLPRVFDRFTQAEVSLGLSGGGLGLGLALVRALVEQHRGTVTARSAGIGQGSEFIVRLPAVITPQPPEPPEPALRALAPMHILVVEDNADSRETLQLMLELSGHRVEAAADGSRAIEMALASRPDVALIDIGLPGLDGHEVARQLRSAGAVRRMIALTGYGQPDDRRQTREAGFDAHLVKPVEPEALWRAIATVPRK